MLTERVYRWAVDDLEYRPEAISAHSGSSYMTSNLALQGTNPKGASFKPQALYNLCSGPLGTVFEHLLVNIRPRSEAQEAQNSALHQTSQHAKRQEARKKRQLIDQQRKTCHELALQIAQTQRDIARSKEHIKRSRQISAAMRLYHDQSKESVMVLQEYHRTLRELERGAGSKQRRQQQDSQDNRRSLAQLKSEIHGVSHQLAVIARELITKDSRLTDQQQHFLKNQISALYDRIRDIPGGPTSFLEIIQSLRGQLLQDYETRSQSSISTESSKSSGLLKIFQAHHAERLEQIEMVLRQIAEKEQLKDDIIEQMQQSSRTLEQTGAHLELELAKARVAAISASLEFVQAEQEILIERALSTEDHSKRLEAIGRGSRATQQEMTQTQQRLQELAQLIFLEHEAVSDRLAQSKEDLSETEPLLTKMAQLSKERMNSVEQGCMATIQRLKQQQERLCGTREAFAPLLCSKQLEDSNLHAPETYVHNAPYLSQDRMALERVVQSFALILHTSLLTQLTETQGMMKDATEQLSAKWRQGTDTCKLALQRVHSEPQLDMNPGDESHQCDTRLETEASTAIETIEKCDDLHQEAAIHEIQQSLEQYDSAVATIQQIESLVQESQMLEDSPWVEK